jgi:hypothetical protein
LKLRREHPALANAADFQPLYAEKNGYPFIYLRIAGSERIVVSVNPAGRFRMLALKEVIKAIPLLVQDAAFREGRFEMGPVSFGIFKVED